MKEFRRLILWGALAPLLLLVCAGDAWAYLDPGTGSYILQILLGCLLGAAFTVKMFWRSITLHISNLVAKVRRRRDGDQ